LSYSCQGSGKGEIAMCITTEELIFELGNYFPSHELVDALGVVYPQYWLGLELETSFQLHLNVIKRCLLCAKKMWS
jgi:hypothetical protein